MWPVTLTFLCSSFSSNKIMMNPLCDPDYVWTIDNNEIKCIYYININYFPIALDRYQYKPSFICIFIHLLVVVFGVTPFRHSLTCIFYLSLITTTRYVMLLPDISELQILIKMSYLLKLIHHIGLSHLRTDFRLLF